MEVTEDISPNLTQRLASHFINVDFGSEGFELAAKNKGGQGQSIQAQVTQQGGGRSMLILRLIKHLQKVH